MDAQDRQAFYENLKQTRLWLAATFPRAFSGLGEMKRPLKIGIDKDVLAAGKDSSSRPSRQMIKAAIADYVSAPTYLMSCRVGCARIGLNGEIVSYVGSREAGFAFHRLIQIKRHMDTYEKRDPELYAKVCVAVEDWEKETARAA